MPGYLLRAISFPKSRKGGRFQPARPLFFSRFISLVVIAARNHAAGEKIFRFGINRARGDKFGGSSSL
jgi:hypothetical protein